MLIKFGKYAHWLSCIALDEENDTSLMSVALLKE